VFPRPAKGKKTLSGDSWLQTVGGVFQCEHMKRCRLKIAPEKKESLASVYNEVIAEAREASAPRLHSTTKGDEGRAKQDSSLAARSAIFLTYEHYSRR